MLNDYGKSLFKPLLSVPNFVLSLSMLFVSGLVVTQVELSTSEWASWVQAVGSIGAIWGALALGRKQINNQETERTRVLQAKAGAFLAVIESACKNAKKISDLVGEQTPPSHLRLRWDSYISELYKANVSMLRNVPAHELGSYELVVAHSVILANMIQIEASLMDLFEWERQVKRLQSRWVSMKYAELTHYCSLIERGLEEFTAAHQAHVQ